MSHQVTLDVLIKDLDLFKECCEDKGFAFTESDLTVRFESRYIGKLQESKDDDGARGGQGYVFKTDSDFVGQHRLASNVPDFNTVSMYYSENICRRQIARMGGTILTRDVSTEGIRLKVCVNG